jgi:hypothetical protein
MIHVILKPRRSSLPEDPTEYACAFLLGSCPYVSLPVRSHSEAQSSPCFIELFRRSGHVTRRKLTFRFQQMSKGTGFLPAVREERFWEIGRDSEFKSGQLCRDVPCRDTRDMSPQLLFRQAYRYRTVKVAIFTVQSLCSADEC